MNLGGTSVRLVVVAAVVAFVGCQAPPNPVALRWLEQDCTVGGRDRLDKELRQQGTNAEPTLIGAFERGPDDAVLDDVAREAGIQWDQVASALAAGRRYGLSTADAAELGTISRAAHVRRARDRFARDYRAAALSGLGVLSLPRGIGVLRRIAADTQSPDHAIAGAVLRRVGLPTAPP